MTEATLRPEITSRYLPFFHQVMAAHGHLIHSVYLTGSVLEDDFDMKWSDITSVIVLHRMELNFLEQLAPLGKKYGKKGVAAPLIMTPAYITSSLDVFPLEFLNLKLLHHPLHGDGLFAGLEINLDDLRRQCERELKVKLIGLRQRYLSAAGDRTMLNQGFTSSFGDYLALFRGIVTLHRIMPPRSTSELLATLQEVSGVDTTVFRNVFQAKKEQRKLSLDQLNTLFEDYYHALEQLGTLVDEHQI
ncbi:MAG: hypothetical protein JXO49_01250 [Deltaproteobacteria bacterium]|nr:hypothetical protein [Candidatus Anaeroferrophillus wilburensis]MBN2887953.1 hypothetical protein [Deltaproteobacteria bacterium]